MAFWNSPVKYPAAPALVIDIVTIAAITAYIRIPTANRFQCPYKRFTTTIFPKSREIAIAMIKGFAPNKVLSPITDTIVPSPSIKSAVIRVRNAKNINFPNSQNIDYTDRLQN